MSEPEQPEPREQANEPEPTAKPDPAPKSIGPKRRRRRRPGDPMAGLERIAEIHYCRSDQEANQYLALGPEWDLQDIIPMRVETEDGGERDEVHFVVARWETDRDRALLRKRDRGFTSQRQRDAK